MDTAVYRMVVSTAMGVEERHKGDKCIKGDKGVMKTFVPFVPLVPFVTLHCISIAAFLCSLSSWIGMEVKKDYRLAGKHIRASCLLRMVAFCYSLPRLWHPVCCRAKE